ncbi:sulfite exporter TauE/SafE family protein [Actinoplanes awajinensis]|uniref:Probable membrane transporter protein n=1 Tax=Actinoplanes awajinensis subsp. mycoplanecinus TaxID=135947 RepID=A0A101JPW6_9ACTN|nr:sulfite exporter TauE/SafE family protein [Actinoplanes awajinensis]KUL30784.1 permease [Actinoplanes awajinensis subsp. mycoplanecinus]
MTLAEAVLLLVAGLGAGTVNAIAGGGSLLTFPAMLAIGMPPVAANVSNALAVAPGYGASVLGSRADLIGQGRRILRVIPTALLGALGGCLLLLNTPRRVFDLVVPFLVIGAALTLAGQTRLRALVGHPQQVSPRRATVMLHTAVFLCALYGGYFNAALGVLLVAGLALVLDETLARVSALKNLLSALIGVVTIAVYSIFGPVNWAAVAVIAPATIVGGYLGARVARRLPAAVLRTVIVAFGLTVGTVLLVRAL